MRPAEQGTERGTALVLAMLLIAVLAVTTQSVVVSARTTVDAGLLERGRTEALAAADGGVALARHRLAADPGWAGGRATIGRSTVEVAVAADADGSFALHIVAASPVRGGGQPVRAVVEARLRPRPGGLPTVAAWRELGLD
jgi:hypothetical protein